MSNKHPMCENFCLCPVCEKNSECKRCEKLCKKHKMIAKFVCMNFKKKKGKKL
jgi:hypothetical protein